MRVNKLFRRKRAENGAGRTVKVKHLLLPEDVVDDLKLFKNCYELCLATSKDENGYPIPIRVTYEQMLKRWMKNIGRFDPDIAKEFALLKAERIKNEEQMARMFGLTSEQMKDNETAFNPADPSNEPWQLRYFFVRNDEQVEALSGDYSPFYAKINGKNISMKNMLADNWILRNDDGVELDTDEAWQVNKLIKEHSTK